MLEGVNHQVNCMLVTSARLHEVASTLLCQTVSIVKVGYCTVLTAPSVSVDRDASQLVYAATIRPDSSPRERIEPSLYRRSAEQLIVDGRRGDASGHIRCRSGKSPCVRDIMDHARPTCRRGFCLSCERPHSLHVCGQFGADSRWRTRRCADSCACLVVGDATDVAALIARRSSSIYGCVANHPRRVRPHVWRLYVVHARRTDALRRTAAAQRCSKRGGVGRDGALID